MTRTTTLLPLLAGAAVLLAGCAPDAPAPAPSSAPPASSASPPSSPSPPPSTQPEPPPLPTGAADGRNLTACTDGSCEVLVSKPASIRLNPKLQVRTLRIESVEADAVTLNLTFPSGNGVKYACEGGTQCTAVGGTSSSEPFAQAVAKAGARITVNGLRVEVVAAHEGTAVLRLTPV
ncbi:hypothetical protein N8J89_33605 [Crossiella sp. CA-258035]|uniref:hypothetical protein n=1 Tax=Crossiella sp. CA-258035 TaxID=2981138 RepID=UPI0024BC289E|nr:hypothetical protein [Crossiella sp. CA-258035]WHT18012.1 hypothetical protein N8J89_33605 [Crossiella sp. CA-258035]